MLDAIKALFRSRKFLLALFGVVQVLVLHFLSVPEEIWQAITLLVLTLIGSIAYEDGKEKGAPVYYEAAPGLSIGGVETDE
jgi:hypothetical protein